MPIIKANGYGTHALSLARTYLECGIDIMGLAYVDEAVELREAGIECALLVCQSSIEEYPLAVKHGLELAVMSNEHIEALNKMSQEKQQLTKAHLKVNTGLNRFGCPTEEALALAQKIHRASHLQFEGVMTHFASADDPYEQDFTLEQVRLFDRVISQLESAGIAPPWKHASNSAALLRYSLPQYNLIRPGIACLGVTPSAACQELCDLQPAIHLRARIIHINTCNQGDSISYGRSYRISSPQARIAAIPLGYADGIHWNYRNRGLVLIHGRQAPIVGNICMDTLLVDVSSVPQAKVGDYVTLIGTEPSSGESRRLLEAAADWGSIPHELLACLGPRIHRVFITQV